MCGALIRGVTQVLRKRWAYLWGPIRTRARGGGGGGGAYRRRNTVFCVDRLLFVVDNSFSQLVIDNFDDTQQSFELTTKSHYTTTTLFLVCQYNVFL